MMKKNKMMRFASMVLVLTMLSTCAISGTFAKYITTTNGTDSARVAYWGFNEDTSDQSTTFELFNSGDAGVLNAGDGLLAPGSTDSATITFEYKDAATTNVTAPEVDYEFKVTPTITSTNKDGTNSLDANDSFTWNVDAPGNANDKTGLKTIADLENAIKAISGDATGVKNYDAGTLPDGWDAGANNITITWNWELNNNQDVMDTAMGNADALEAIEIKIEITATQLDAYTPAAP